MIKYYLFFILVFIAATAMPQADTVMPALLKVGAGKTTSVIFPQVIKSIDRGSKDLLIQKVVGAENILQIKAAKDDFPETNLTVITAEGKLYEFTVCFTDNPGQLTLYIDKGNSNYERVAVQRKSIRGIKNDADEMRLRLNGIFIQNQILYFQFELENFSAITYDPDMLRFYIGDKQQGTRTAIQQLDQVPIYIYHKPVSVPGGTKQRFVAAFSQFTLSRKQRFNVWLTEKNGGRSLEIKISNKKIVKAKPI